jgi:hypothetical protein
MNSPYSDHVCDIIINERKAQRAHHSKIAPWRDGGHAVALPTGSATQYWLSTAATAATATTAAAVTQRLVFARIEIFHVVR